MSAAAQTEPIPDSTSVGRVNAQDKGALWRKASNLHEHLRRLRGPKGWLVVSVALFALLAYALFALDRAARYEQDQRVQALAKLTATGLALEMDEALRLLDDETLADASGRLARATFAARAGTWVARTGAVTHPGLGQLDGTPVFNAAQPTLVALPQGHLVLAQAQPLKGMVAVALDVRGLAQRYGLRLTDSVAGQVHAAALQLDERGHWREPVPVVIPLFGAGVDRLRTAAVEAASVRRGPALQVRIGAVAPPLLARNLTPLALALAATLLLAAALAYTTTSLAATRAVSDSLVHHLDMTSKAFSAGVSIWRRDADGRMLMRWRDEGWTCSAAADSIETISRVIHPDDRAATVDAFRVCVRGPVGTVHAGEYRALADDGTYHRYSTKRVKVLNADGEPEVVGVTIDLTKWLRSQPLTESIERISGSMDALFWTAHQDGLVEFHGPQDKLAHRGGRGPHAVPKVLERICEEDRAAVHEAFAASLREGKAWRMTFRVQTRSGSLRTMQAAAEPFFDFHGRYQGLFGLTLDITESIKDRLALEAARATSEANARYIRHLSHEVRNPLHQMSAIVELLTASERDGDEVAKRKWLDLLSMTSRRTVEVVGAMLDFLHLSERRMVVTPKLQDVRQTVQEAVAAASAVTQRRGQRLSLTVAHDADACLALFEPRALARVLDNLLSNASKFSPCGSAIAVHVCTQEAPALGVCVEVCDEGPGLQPEDLQQLGTPFFRARATAESVEGAGLGVSIAHELVKAMGGELRYENVTDATGARRGLKAVVRLQARAALSEAA